MLQGKVAVITGGSSGIGKAIADKFEEHGATVAVLDIHEQSDCKRFYIQANVAVKEEVQAAIEKVLSEFGKIDILINNAGIFRDNKIPNISEQDWDDVLNVNLKGTFNGIQAVTEQMKEQQYGKIVNISSVSYKGNYGQANYSASKAGIVSLTQTAALELSPYITVNCVAPGPINTPLFQSMDEKGKTKFLKKVPLGKAGEPEEIANAVTFLASDASSYVTGVVLPVDGGLTCGLNLR